MYKRIIAFDVGDVWIGVAHTDLLQTIAIPYQTWLNKDFDEKFNYYLLTNKIQEAIIGLPMTMTGFESKQTHKIISWMEEKKNQFVSIQFRFFDERLSSRFAKKIIQANKNNKNSDHSIAASVILENFLLYNKQF